MQTRLLFAILVSVFAISGWIHQVESIKKIKRDCSLTYDPFLCQQCCLANSMYMKKFHGKYDSKCLCTRFIFLA